MTKVKQLKRLKRSKGMRKNINVKRQSSRIENYRKMREEKQELKDRNLKPFVRVEMEVTSNE
jgi:hypothetical protein